MFARGASFRQRFSPKKAFRVSNNDGNRIKTADLEALVAKVLLVRLQKLHFPQTPEDATVLLCPQHHPETLQQEILNKHRSLLAAALLFDQPFYCMCCPNEFWCVSAALCTTERSCWLLKQRRRRRADDASVESGSFCSRTEEKDPVCCLMD